MVYWGSSQISAYYRVLKLLERTALPWWITAVNDNLANPELSVKGSTNISLTVVGWIVAPKIYIYLNPLNVSLFGIKIFADITKIRILGWDHPRLDMYLYRRQKGRRHMETQDSEYRGRDMSISQGMTRIARATEARIAQILLQTFQKEPALLTHWFQISGLQNFGRINFCFLKPPRLW